LTRADLPAGVQPFLVPAHTSLAAVRDVLGRSSPVLLGAQNAHWDVEGAWTGEVSMRMVADAGAQLVELGHSERRAAFGETDETVARKARAAVDAGLRPLICVGEPAEVRDAGQAGSFVASQARAALSLLSPQERGHVLVAYEPVWAIGAFGRVATPEELAPTTSALWSALADLCGGRQVTRLLYGGSVARDDARWLLDVPHVGGLFVGRAAWDVDGYVELLRIAGAHVAAAAVP
jgi:triosephosphate isomerase